MIGVHRTNFGQGVVTLTIATLSAGFVPLACPRRALSLQTTSGGSPPRLGCASHAASRYHLEASTWGAMVRTTQPPLRVPLLALSREEGVAAIADEGGHFRIETVSSLQNQVDR